MFLLRHSDNPALKLIWNLTGDTGGITYILGLGVAVAIALHLMYAIYMILNRTLGKNARSNSLS